MGENEEYEHVPWTSLVPESTDNTGRWMMLGAVAVIALLGGMGIARLMAAPATDGAIAVPGTGQAAEPKPAVVVTSAIGAPDPSDQSTTTVVPTPVAQAPPTLFSEADLMAVMPEDNAMLVAMRAEWFVTEFFTVGGAPEAADQVRHMLGANGPGLALPHDKPPHTSYVEWARAYRVVESTSSRFEVEVAFRMLVEDDDGSFIRQPLTAVLVPIVADSDGGFGVADLPAAIPLPELGFAPPWAPPREAPPDVEAAALSELALVGEPGTVLGSTFDEDGWRLVVETAIAGIGFPLVVRPPLT